MCEFIAQYRARFGVAPICRVLSAHGHKIAPRTFYAYQKRPPSKRALWDMTITEVLAGYYEPDQGTRRPPESLYGSLKMWAHLNREGIEVARCTVERLMRANGWQGVTRAKRVRTTISALRISAGGDGGEEVPVGSAGVEQGADPVVAESAESEADAFDPFDQVVDRFGGSVR